MRYRDNEEVELPDRREEPGHLHRRLVGAFPGVPRRSGEHRASSSSAAVRGVFAAGPRDTGAGGLLLDNAALTLKMLKLNVEHCAKAHGVSF